MRLLDSSNQKKAPASTKQDLAELLACYHEILMIPADAQRYVYSSLKNVTAADLFESIKTLDPIKQIRLLSACLDKTTDLGNVFFFSVSAKEEKGKEKIIEAAKKHLADLIKTANEKLDAAFPVTGWRKKKTSERFANESLLFFNTTTIDKVCTQKEIIVFRRILSYMELNKEVFALNKEDENIIHQLKQQDSWKIIRKCPPLNAERSSWIKKLMLAMKDSNDDIDLFDNYENLLGVEVELKDEVARASRHKMSAR